LSPNPHGIRGWRWRPLQTLPLSKGIKPNQRSGFRTKEAKAEPARTSLASSLYYHCSFGWFRRPTGSRAPLRSARRGARARPTVSRRGRAHRLVSSLLPCGDVTPLPLVLSAAAAAGGDTRRGRSRSAARLRSAAPPQQRQRQRLRHAGNGCARCVPFAQLKSQCSHAAAFLSPCVLTALSRRRGRGRRDLGRVGGRGGGIQ